MCADKAQVEGLQAQPPSTLGPLWGALCATCFARTAGSWECLHQLYLLARTTLGQGSTAKRARLPCELADPVMGAIHAVSRRS